MQSLVECGLCAGRLQMGHRQWEEGVGRHAHAEQIRWLHQRARVAPHRPGRGSSWRDRLWSALPSAGPTFDVLPKPKQIASTICGP
jgi:hypothetical protein